MRQFLFLLLILTTTCLQAQNVGIGTTTPNNNAALEINSNSKGLLIPRLSTTAKNNMTSVTKGMLVYDTTYSNFYYHDGSKWRIIGERNPDSLLINYLNSPQETVNMSSGSTTAQSGILYDNGGPAGNYANNSNNSYFINPYTNDSIVGYKVVVEQMNTESPYDSLEIYTDYEGRKVFSGTTTGTYYFTGGNGLHFDFRSNGVNNSAGFRIRWSAMTLPAAHVETPPLYGWYFNARKMAVRGGTPGTNEWSTDSLGKYSFAFGNDVKAKGIHSIAFGQQSKALGSYSTAIGGYAVNAIGDYSVAIGSGYYYANAAYGNYSAAIGFQNIALGSSSYVFGEGNEAIGSSSTAIGSSNITIGNGSHTFGLGLISNAYRSTSLGVFNDTALASRNTWISDQPILVVGNGSSNGARNNALVILKNGNIGIGTDAPAASLHIRHAAGGGLILENSNDDNKWRIYSASGNNNLTFYNNANTVVADIDDVNGTYTSISDGRLKKNIQNLPSILPLVMKLTPSYYQFNWQKNDEQRQLGLIAQQAYKLFPELVSYDKEKDLYKMNYAGFSTVAIKAIQEQQVIIEALQRQMENMQRQIDELKNNKK